MAERTVITELVQLGVETVYGTGVAATKRLASLGIDLAPQFEATRIRPMGYKIDTIVAPMREWAGGSLSGYPTYNENPYVFNSLIKKVSPTTTTGVSTWTWDWSATSVETVDSFTVEQGDPNSRAHEVTGAVIAGYNCSWSRTADPTVGGTMLARAFEDGITVTPALTAEEPVPIIPSHIDVYADATWAGKGTTKLLRVMSAGITINNMWGPLWVLNSANSSFQTIIQQAPDVSLSLTLEADAAGMAYLTQMRAGSLVVIEIKATGADIPGGTPTTPFSQTIDFAGRIDGPPAFGDTDGVRTATWNFRNTLDATSGKSLLITLVNGTASL